ncbi:ankyrin repeat-containing domain protein [Mycena metata]|uniref:Ankyrin repeat-containing domain protein n=1 Tax=Mycena metata TaxID=1033252 RepID=A0AAD7H066_9AGAR|nr:ankyrin repeat-containing domain protein [Mycena metata]
MYDGGLSLTPAIASILSQDGYLDIARHGQKLRELYRAESLNFSPRKLSPFALAVFCGNVDLVAETFSYGLAPALTSAETPFRFGYATLAVLGSQRLSDLPGSIRHIDVLRFLFEKGLPVDHEDIMGFTALHHATVAPNASEEVTRWLLHHGADVNHRNRFGEISLLGCMQLDLVAIIGILLDNGVDLDIPDADGVTARDHFVYCGPRVIAVVARAIRTRAGVVSPPRSVKCCDTCAVVGVRLKVCGCCKVARYCSRDCQASAWSVHKSACTAFSPSTTVTVQPFYEPCGRTVPVADYTRRVFGYPVPDALFSERQTRTSRSPRSFKKGPKVLVVKVQVPPSFEERLGDILVYTKRRSFACTIRRQDDSVEYDRLSAAVRTNGLLGVKAYLMAELESRNKLVVKITDVLAEQPW